MTRVALGFCFVLALACTPADPTYYPSVSWVSKPIEPNASSHVRVSDQMRVKGCRYIGTFVFKGPASAESPPWWHQQQVVTLAEAQGATDVVFDPSAGGSVGKGYQCRAIDGGPRDGDGGE